MTWDVFYTNAAKADLYDIHSYIQNSLLEPITANRLYFRILDAGDSLDILPYRHPKYENEPWHSRGLRYKMIDNYMMFYIPLEEKVIVVILRIMYASRDIDSELGKTDYPASFN
jgi:toxin ParE1/3/4